MTIQRVFDVLAYQKENYPKDDTLSMIKDGKWVRNSIDDVIALVDKLSIAMMKQNIKKGDTVALFANNRVEWNIVDFACQQIGAILVPLYVTLSEKDLRYIFEHAECKMAFVSDEELFNKVKAVDQNLSIFTFDKVNGAHYWESLFDQVSVEDLPKLNEIKAEIKSTDCATIIYTSGTTGNPKGVMLSHQNIVFNITTAADGVIPEFLKGGTKALSFLPLCHIAERLLNIVYVYYGISIYHAENMDTISRDLQDVKPEFFIAVPRLLEKVFEKIQLKGSELTGLKRALFYKSIAIAKSYHPGAKKTIMHKLLDKLVFSKWRAALGGKIIAIGCGAAPLQPELMSVFHAAGIPVLEAYGLTETAPLISATIYEPLDIRLGCAGTIVPGVEVKIAEDGEILCKGPNIMMGYYKDPEKTNDVIKDGWFHTGDVGEILEGRFLKITDRKKEMFKTSGGKYIAPGYVENLFKTSRWIDHIMVIGVNQKFPAALIVPSIENLHSYADHKGLSFSSDEEMLNSEKIRDLFEREVTKINSKLGQWEQIKEFRLMKKPWSVDGGELTPTMKLKRRVINVQYAEIIDEIYS